MSKEFNRLLPLVAFELPDLAGGEDGDDTRPVLGLELFGGVDEDESDGTCGVDGGEDAGDVEDGGRGAGC